MPKERLKTEGIGTQQRQVDVMVSQVSGRAN